MKLLKKWILSNDCIFLLAIKLYARLNKMNSIKIHTNIIELRKNDKIFLMNYSNRMYAFDVIREFDNFTDSVEGVLENGLYIYDFTKSDSHKLKDENIDFYYTALPESPETNKIYLKHLNLKQDDIVIDLGSYCGYSSYVFSKQVGANGKVICVEADADNYSALVKNINNLNLSNIEPINKAIWSTETTLDFISESSLGSSVKDCVDRKGRTNKIETITLNGIVNKFNLQKIDAIKMDIEGAEYNIFSNIDDFIDKFSPKFIIEVHKNAQGKIDTEFFNNIFERHNYIFSKVQQSKKEPFPLIYAESK